VAAAAVVAAATVAAVVAIAIDPVRSN